MRTFSHCPSCLCCKSTVTKELFFDCCKQPPAHKEWWAKFTQIPYIGTVWNIAIFLLYISRLLYALKQAYIFLCTTFI